MKLVSIIIVNWNGKSDTLGCLQSLAKITYPQFEVIVLDNGSTDGSTRELKNLKTKKFPLRLIENKENLGFAEGNNMGVEVAKGEYILLLNNDTTVESNFLEKLVAELEEDKTIGVVQPKIIFARSEFEEAGQLQSGSAFLTNSGFLYHFGYGKDPENPKYNQRMEIFSANGAAMLIRRSLINRVGLFDPDFFGYFEETDFCWRVWLAGYKVLYVPQAVIHHKGKQATKRLASGFVNFHSYKNRVCTLLKNLSARQLFKILPVHLLFCQLAAIAYLAMWRPQVSWGIERAIWWNLAHLGQTLGKRLRVQTKIRKISDERLLPGLTRPVRPSYYFYLMRGLEGYED